MKTNIQDFVSSCNTFQINKGETVKIARELQQLPIPTQILTDISMDFIMGLPKETKKSVIMVVFDHISKVGHFCALAHHFNPSLVAQDFMDQIFKLHGMPIFIVSYRDPTFTNSFW